jgi:hypothetical protein
MREVAGKRRVGMIKMEWRLHMTRNEFPITIRLV